MAQIYLKTIYFHNSLKKYNLIIDKLILVINSYFYDMYNLICNLMIIM